MAKVHIRGESSVTIRKHPGYSKRKDRKYFMYRGHQGKEKAYLEALKKYGGYVPSVQRRMGIRFALYDMDGGHRRPVLENFHKRGVPIFIYPHAARPMIIWDGIWEPWPYVAANFVTGAGQKKVMELYGYPMPIEVVGWTYCDLLPFTPVEKPKNILFGPIHPSVSGWVAKEDKEANRLTQKVLHKYCKETGAKLTVRHIKSLQMNGIEQLPGVTYVAGKPDLAIGEIDQADVVVGHQTFAYLAIARGKPTIMMREDLPPHTVSHGATVYAQSWEKYAELMRYPLDILAGEAGEVITRACAGCSEAEAWRERFIGEAFDGKRFVERLESYL